MSFDAPGLRDRKKAATRRTIQKEALRLIAAQGYTATTVTQIAAAANISPATFFHYFSTKEAVVLHDALDVIMAASEEPPAQLSSVAAVRWILRTAFDALSAQELEQQRQRHMLIQSIPELRAGMARELADHIELLSRVLARRSGRLPSDVAVRSVAGAIIGALLAALTTLPERSDVTIVQVLDDGLAVLETELSL